MHTIDIWLRFSLPLGTRPVSEPSRIYLTSTVGFFILGSFNVLVRFKLECSANRAYLPCSSKSMYVGYNRVCNDVNYKKENFQDERSDSKCLPCLYREAMRLQCLTPTHHVMGGATFPYACTGKPYPCVCNVCRPHVK